MTLRFLRVAVLGMLVLTGCGGSPTREPGPRVAIVYDSSVPDERQVVAPGVLAARLGLREAGLVPLDVDTRGDAALTVGIAADPDVVAIIVTPFVAVPTGAWAAWARAGVAVVSLNQLAPPGGWVRQLVPTLSDTVSAMDGAAPTGVCVVAGAPGWAATYATSLLRAAPGWRGVTDTTGCDRTVWSGPATNAPPPGPGLWLTDQARTTGYLRAAGPARGAPRAVCGCVDPGSVADPALQSFVHRYQAETGLDPGPYAAEAYDAAALIVAAWRRGGGRGAIAQTIAVTDDYRGVAATYAWEGSGLVTPDPRIYRGFGWRWVPDGSVALPGGTEPPTVRTG